MIEQFLVIAALSVVAFLVAAFVCSQIFTSASSALKAMSTQVDTAAYMSVDRNEAVAANFEMFRRVTEPLRNGKWKGEWCKRCDRRNVAVWATRGDE